MSPERSRVPAEVRRILVAAAIAALAIAIPGAAGAARAATEVEFGKFTTSSTFLSSVDVSEQIMLPDVVHRTEVLVRTGTSDIADVADVPVSRSSGWSTIAYHLQTPSGAIIPNTLIRFQFRVTLLDGSVELGPETSIRYADTRFTWKTMTGTIVTVHWVDGDDAFGQRALSIGEKAIADASALLGVTETEPIDFFVYPDDTSFRQVIGPGARENVGGVAFPDIRTLLADIPISQVNDPWVGIVVPHELTHLVFGTATDNPYHEPPHWLNEGLAVYLSQGFDDSDRSAVAGAVQAGTLMPLPSLAGQFPTAGDRFSLAYSESVSAIDFMVRTYGKPALVSLIRSYASGRTDDEAFKAALGVDVAGFEAAWVAELGATEPSPRGPQPAPAGVVPPGWDAAASPGTPVGGGGGPASTPAPSVASSSDAVVIGGGLAIVAVVLVVVIWLALRRHGPASPAP